MQMDLKNVMNKQCEVVKAFSKKFIPKIKKYFKNIDCAFKLDMLELFATNTK